MSEPADQFNLFRQVLARLEQLGILRELMLVGSWAFYAYREQFAGDPRLPLVRTLDLDFLVPHPPHFSHRANLPAELKTLGFDWQADRLSGAESYVHPQLEIEFLFSERGRGRRTAYPVEALQVQAEGLRYMDILLRYPLRLPLGEYTVTVPRPEAFMWHKLLIRERREAAKARKDLQQVQSLVAIILEQPEGLAQLRGILHSCSASWQRKLQPICRDICPELLPCFEENSGASP